MPLSMKALAEQGPVNPDNATTPDQDPANQTRQTPKKEARIQSHMAGPFTPFSPVVGASQEEFNL